MMISNQMDCAFSMMMMSKQKLCTCAGALAQSSPSPTQGASFSCPCAVRTDHYTFKITSNEKYNDDDDDNFYIQGTDYADDQDD